VEVVESKPVSVGIVGLGTVGSGTFNVLQRNAGEIARRVKGGVRVAQIGARRDNPNSDTGTVDVVRDVFEVVDNPDIDILVELIGGTTVAKELVMKAIENGKHVVTANKALIAEHGNEIFAKAEENGVSVAYEAAVAGGIPIIKSLREGLAANRIQWVAGIINGTGNFILTEMKEKGRDFNDVLKEAQDLGYAEADPTFDVEGIDAAHKLAILASIAFGMPLQFDRVFTEGITRITPEDVKYAEELGYRIKHLGLTRRSAQGIELRVHPTLIPENRLIANVNGVMNAVMVMADAVGATLYYGAGAGAEPTASAVVADVVDVARAITNDPGNRVPGLAFEADQLLDPDVLPIEEVETCYYIRMKAKDTPGVMSRITGVFSAASINLESILQKEAEVIDGEVPIIMLTRKVREKNMDSALVEIAALDDIVGEIVRIRLEHLEET